MLTLDELHGQRGGVAAVDHHRHGDPSREESQGQTLALRAVKGIWALVRLSHQAAVTRRRVGVAVLHGSILPTGTSCQPQRHTHLRASVRFPRRLRDSHRHGRSKGCGMRAAVPDVRSPAGILTI